MRGQQSPKERLNSLVEATIASEQKEQMVDSFYASRNALFTRAARNEPDLDHEFMQFLKKTRSQGNLRAEPRIYRRYGDWLKLQGRYTEAIWMYKTSLDRVIAAEWHPIALLLFSKLAAAYLDAGQDSMAFEMMDQFETYLENHEDIPPHAVLAAIKFWIPALLSNGHVERARLDAARWHAYGLAHVVPDKHLHVTSVDYIDAFLARFERPESIPSVESASSFLHPKSVTTVGMPNQLSRSAYFLMNLGASPQEGLLKIHGAYFEQQEKNRDDTLTLQFVPSDIDAPVSIPLSLPGGTLMKIRLEHNGKGENETLEIGDVRLEWTRSDSEKGTSVATWHFSEGADPESAAILEAAEIKPNPFVGVPVEHSIFFSETNDQLYLPIRIRSKKVLRIEYRDPDTGSVIAVDDNGNGNFLESGDFWIQNQVAQEVAAPHVFREENTQLASIEIWYYPDVDSSSVNLDLSVEVYINNEWQTQAIDALSF